MIEIEPRVVLISSQRLLSKYRILVDLGTFFPNNSSYGLKVMIIVEDDSDEVNSGLGNSPPPNPVSGDVEVLSLMDRQLTVFKALEKKDSSLAGMYLGSVIVLRDESNPDRYQQSALSLRELMKNLHNVITDAPTLVQDLEIQVLSLINKSKKWRSENSDIGVGVEISEPLSRFLNEFDKFMGWCSENLPRGYDRARDISTGLDPARARNPKPDMDEDIKLWQRCYKVMNDVLHHHPGWTLGEFEHFQKFLENFLINRIAPRAFQNFTQLDLLIAEGEGHD